MVFWAVIFFAVAIVAAILGFAIVIGTAALIAKTLSILFIVLFFYSLFRARKSVPR